MNKKTVELDPYKREPLEKELLLHVLCLRDVSIIKFVWDKIKDKNLEKLTQDDFIAGITTIIISYGRIFGKNDEIGKVNTGNFKSSSKISEEEELLHNYLIHLRNSSYAHNAPTESTVDIYYDKSEDRIVAKSYVSFPYLTNYKEHFSSLIEKIEQYLEEQKNYFISKLYTLDAEHSVKKAHKVLGYRKGIFVNNLPYKE